MYRTDKGEIMDTTRVKIEGVRRGDMIPGWGGVVIADTLSHTTNGIPFWYDTNGQRHAWGMDGTAIIYVPTIRTQEVGHSGTGKVHALRNSGGAACGSKAPLDVWEGGTALASVTCKSCRRRYNLVGDYSRSTSL